ncbi:PAS domain-containing sensor histidine kinase [Lutibacter sp. HS1-25]|uniref:PAS domain-containing sensor histidine kinase n=1 Tax=Lutibacter sp. HS1-25 TaxID=2485000 RepID=UPI0010101E38|nr:PAS domain-containing sensor histidine kinase [Lutibacter sp. HS1-25]RXP61878.1 PAS domain-containing sensor histidine kinase [Lutibacter sp. HS1-25]
MILNTKTSFYKVCFDSMQLGILVFDRNKNIVLANNPSAKIFGFKPDIILNIKIDDLFKNTNVISDFIKNPQLKKYKSAIELTGCKKNGDPIFVELTFGKMEYEGELYFKILLSDISLRKEKEKQISHLNAHLESELEIRNIELQKLIDQLQKSLDKEKELNNLKSTFLALASHEFKTPLSAILSSTELMSKYADNGNLEKRKEHLSKIKLMIQRLNGMLDDFLTLENIEKGIIQPAYNWFKLSYLSNQISKNTIPFLKDHQVLNVKILNDEEVYHDIKIITIILNNLLSNSIKYSNKNGVINVKISSKKSAIIITVEDYGIGIPKSEQNLILNRFFRAKNAMYYPGTGIGLNIIQGYIANLNGVISFESTENKGTTFKIELPKIICNEKKDITN